MLFSADTSSADPLGIAFFALTRDMPQIILFYISGSVSVQQQILLSSLRKFGKAKKLAEPKK
jgi:hypothetical protein